MTGRPLGWSPGRREDLGRTAMQHDPGSGVDRVVDGGANDRVEELDRVYGTEEIDPHQPACRLACDDEVELGERGGVAKLASVAENRRRSGDRDRVWWQAAEADRDRSGDRARAKPEHGLGVRAGRLESFLSDRVEQCTHEQRVPARGNGDGGAERLSRLEPESRAGELRDRGKRQRSRLDDQGRRVGEQLVEQRRVVALLGRSRRGDNDERKPLQPTHEVPQPVQRRSVGPVQVVDDQAGRLQVGEVRGQPVEPVLDREGRVGEGRRRSRLDSRE